MAPEQATTAAATAAPEVRQCPGCGLRLPLTSEHWHKRTGTSFHTFCKLCRNAQAAEQTQKANDARLTAIERRGLALMTEIQPGGAMIPHSAELVEAFMEGFGGVNGFVQTCLKHYHDCAPGGAHRTAMLRTVATLVTKNAELGGARKPLDLCTDAELEQQWERAIDKAVARELERRQQQLALPRLVDATVVEAGEADYGS